MKPVYILNAKKWQMFSYPNDFLQEARMNPRDIDRIEAPKAEQSRLIRNGSCETAPSTGQYDPSAKDCCARERTSRELLIELCMQKQVEADELNDLLKALPQELPYRADRALRRLIQK